MINLFHSYSIDSLIDSTSSYQRTISQYSYPNRSKLKISNFKMYGNTLRTRLGSTRYTHRTKHSWNYRLSSYRHYNRRITLSRYYCGKYGFSNMIDDILSGNYDPPVDVDEYIDYNH